MINPFETFKWWTGVVEDRKDPLFLGRCRVRIHGVHSKFKKPITDNGVTGDDFIPVEELPWALPTNSITSASMTGIGQAPVGPVEGTWVFGFFMDGGEMQVPIMVGSIGGIEMNEKAQDPSVPISGDGTPQPPASQPQATKVVPVQAPTAAAVENTTGGVLGPLTQDDYNKLKAALGKRESGNNYSVTNQYGYVGKYQFGNAELNTLGYTRASSYNNHLLNNSDNWTGKNGATSVDQYKNDPALQEKVMDDEMSHNYNALLKNGTLNANSSKEDVAGYLAAAHLDGIGGATKLSKGTINADANGTTTASYYKLGAQAIDSSAKAVPPLPPTDTGVGQPQNNIISPDQTPPSAPQSFDDALGFSDPNKVYPKFDEQDKRPDTNYLAYRDHIEKTSVKKKEDARKTRVSVALDADKIWDQPLSPYNATYPYNHVMESESGHVMEFDDTAGNERINLWHRKGTFIEIDKNGTQVNKIVGDGYMILDRNGYITIAGKCNLTIEGDGNIYVKNNANIQVDGDTKAKFYRDVTSEVSGKFKMSVLGDFDVRAKSFHFESYSDNNGEAFTIKNKSADGAIKIESAGDIDLFAHKKMKQGSNDKFSIRTSDIFAADAKVILFQRGASDTVDMISMSLPDNESMFDPDPMKNPEESNFPALHTIHYTDISGVYYDEPGFPPDEVAQHIDNNIANGNFSPNDFTNVPETDTPDTTPPPPTSTTPVTSPTGFEKADAYSPALQLSPNFTLSQLSSGAVITPMAVVDQHGFTTGQIASNLRVLANTVLEPILAQYPSMIVTSGFRLDTGSSKISQHELGQAVDLQFPGFEAADYHSIAQWIRDNCTFDQLILEYKTTGSGTPWIHVSCNVAGNRGQVMTMMNSQPLSGSTDLNPIVPGTTSGPTKNVTTITIPDAGTTPSVKPTNPLVVVTPPLPTLPTPTDPVIQTFSTSKIIVPANVVDVGWGSGVEWQPFLVKGSQVLPIRFTVSTLLKASQPQIFYSNAAGSNQFKVQLSDQPTYGQPLDPNMNEIIFNASLGGRFVISVNKGETKPIPYVVNLVVGQTYYIIVQNIRPNLGTQTIYLSMPV